MKEINLIPQWYQESKKHRSRCYIQYIAIAAAFILVVLICVAAEAYVAAGKSRLGNLEKEYEAYRDTSNEYEKMRARINELKKKTSIINQIDAKMDITCVLGEISFLLDDALIIKKIEITSEPFAGETKKAAGNSSGLRVANQYGNSSKTCEGNIKFKISLNGIASQAGKVADLICKLEESPYFFQAAPSFSRNITVSSGRQGQPEYYAAEFEISCYLANFSESSAAAANL